MLADRSHIQEINNLTESRHCKKENSRENYGYVELYNDEREYIYWKRNNNENKKNVCVVR
jgi:hypothetical protein